MSLVKDGMIDYKKESTLFITQQVFNVVLYHTHNTLVLNTLSKAYSLIDTLMPSITDNQYLSIANKYRIPKEKALIIIY